MSAKFIPLTGSPSLMVAYNISRQGDLVVGECPPLDALRGRGGVARLVKGTWKLFQLPAFSSAEGHSSPAFGVGSVGVVVGYSPRGNPALDTPYKWFSSKPSQLVALKMFPGDKACIAYAVTANGRTIVGEGCTKRLARFRKQDPFHHALVWNAVGGLPRHIDPSPNEPEEDVAVCVSSSGNVVGGFACTPLSKPNLYDPLSYSRGHEPMFWRRDQFGIYHRGLLPSLVGFEHSGRVEGINDDGDRMVGFVGVRKSSVPIRWTLAGGRIHIQPMANLPGYASGHAVGVSGSGSIITGNCWRGDDSNFEAEAFLWDPAHGTRNLAHVLLDAGAVDVTGWNLTDAPGLSSDGRWICGTGWSPNGDLQAWVAYL